MKKKWAWIVAWVCAASGAMAEGPKTQDSVQAMELTSSEHIEIDGRLEDPAWQRANAYPLAFKYAPSTVAAEIPETTYRILVDREYLYIGVDCRDPNPKAIWKALSHRDTVTNADTIKIWLDPQGARKFAQIFKIAAGGAIRDATYYEDSGQEDASPDFPFESATHVDAHGWSVEVKIPASSLRLSGQGQPTILVSRYYPRGNGFTFTSTDINDRHQCILCKNPTLIGLTNLRRGSALTVTPYTSITKSSGDLGNATKGRAGADLKWRLSDAAVIDATLYPDFSQVELDTPQLSSNASYALFYPEKRPFFLEGLDLFDTPMRAVYTRTITRPNWGARVTHRGDSTAVLLVAQDQGGGSVLLPGPWSTDVASQPAATAAIARARFSVYGAQVGAFAALRDYGFLGNNVVGGGDAVYSTANNRFNAQVLASSTSALPISTADGNQFAKGDAQDGSAAYLSWKHDSSKWHARAFIQRVANQFRDDSGFVEANGLYSSEVFAGRDIKPIFGWGEVLPYLLFRHKETLDGETISTDYMPGISVDAGAGTHVEVLVMPASQRRVDTGHELHRLSFAELDAITSPARWFPSSELTVDVGDRLDRLSDRVGSGYSVFFVPTFLALTRLRISATLAQEYIGADVPASPGSGQPSKTRTLLRDSIAAINTSYFFNPNNELRGTFQHNETNRDPLAFTQTVTEHVGSDLISLVYTWTPSLGKAFYAGGTWSSAEAPTQTEGAEFFVKLSWVF